MCMIMLYIPKIIIMRINIQLDISLFAQSKICHHCSYTSIIIKSIFLKISLFFGKFCKKNFYVYQ